jgi:DNA-binding transcriptional ArsR family regulator
MTMSPPFEELSGLDRLVHEPARLAILSALASCRAADFMFLQSLTGLTKGNLSNHLGKLALGSLITVEKSFTGKVQHTSIQLTPQGRDSIRRHWERLEQLHKAALEWRPWIAFGPAEG